ncbi:MAG: hypothetical protein IJN34_08545 [Clostridia bacterium]|nr:hypothetical protein [Clostridia bacterium]
MILIDKNILGAALAFLLGLAVAAANYGLSRLLLIKQPRLFAAGQVIRQILSVGYLLALYFLGGKTPWNPLWLLIGGGLGLTLPLLWSTKRLVQLSQGKEDSADG